MTNGFAWKFIFLSIVEAERTTRKKTDSLYLRKALRGMKEPVKTTIDTNAIRSPSLVTPS